MRRALFRPTWGRSGLHCPSELLPNRRPRSTETFLQLLLSQGSRISQRLIDATLREGAKSLELGQMHSGLLFTIW